MTVDLHNMDYKAVFPPVRSLPTPAIIYKYIIVLVKKAVFSAGLPTSISSRLHFRI
tara:strand:+ start:1489 stop:1656 length:168 start_codon:yes stop_codon:yes gene_type:complete